VVALIFMCRLLRLRGCKGEFERRLMKQCQWFTSQSG
jgi:hypothetical protein